MDEQKFHEYLYEVENWLDEFAIAVLSFGAIFVSIWAFFWAPQEIGFISYGKIIQPWITMLALMIIARELWLMNLHNRKRSEALEEGE